MSVYSVVRQEEMTGCGIASVANILGITYQEAKEQANALGIYAEDELLYSDTQYVRTLLSHYSMHSHSDETPFTTWQALPDLALLAIKHYQEAGQNFWHWVVFKRIEGQDWVFDSSMSLAKNLRDDLDQIQPKWFIPVNHGR